MSVYFLKLHLWECNI